MKKIIQHFDIYPVTVDYHTHLVRLPEDLLFSGKTIDRISILTADDMPVFNTGEKLIPSGYLNFIYLYLADDRKNRKHDKLSGSFLRINSNLGITVNSKIDFSRSEIKINRNELLEAGETYLMPILIYYSDRPKQPFTEPSSSYLLRVPVVPSLKFYFLHEFGAIALTGKQVARLQVSGLTDGVMTLRTADGFVINQIPLSVFVEDLTSENVYLDKTEIDWYNSFIEVNGGSEGEILLNFYYLD